MVLWLSIFKWRSTLPVAPFPWVSTTKMAQKHVRIASAKLVSGDNMADVELQGHRDAHKRVAEQCQRDTSAQLHAGLEQPPTPSHSSNTPVVNALTISHDNEIDNTEAGTKGMSSLSIAHSLISGILLAVKQYSISVSSPEPNNEDQPNPTKRGNADKTTSKGHC